MEEIEPPHKELEELPRSKEIYKAVVAHSRDAVLGVNRKGIIIFWNKGAEQTFGYASTEILGQSVTRLISKNDRKRQSLILRAFLSGNRRETSLIQAEALRKDGSTFPLELSFSIEQRNSKFLALAVGRNITERKSAEQALRASAERYCDLFAACLEAILSVEVPDNSGASNKPLDKLCGYCLEELSEMKPTGTISPERKEYLSKQVDMILSMHEPVSSIVHKIFSEDGKKILVEQYLSFISRKGDILRSQGGCSDTGGSSVREEQAKNYFLNLAIIVSRVVESCDPYTAGHQQRVAELASLVGQNMGLATDMVERLYLDGLLHDIGKISIPRSILTKPGELTEEEWALIRAHTKQGYRILKDTKLPWPIADVALQHHERLDGSGYPDGITEDKLSSEVNILAVCDVVEAMSSYRPYRPARTTRDVLKELEEGRGTRYHQDVVDVMLPMVESGEFASVWNHTNSENGAT